MISESAHSFTFNSEIEYNIIQTGENIEKPLVIYLHGFMQNKNVMKRKMKSLFEFEAHHLFVNGIYPLYDPTRKKKVEDWGRAWYLYDGNQDQFRKSLTEGSLFIKELVEKLKKQYSISRVCLIGYSMGGYLAGYCALSFPDMFRDFAVIAGRIKSEAFNDSQLNKAIHMNVAAIHGKNDTSVYPDPQIREIDKLKALGFNAEYYSTDSEHKLDEEAVKKCHLWLKKLDYKVAI